MDEARADDLRRLQSLVADLWTDARTTGRVQRAAATYTERRNALLGALAEHDIVGHGRSGLNVWVPVASEDLVFAGLQARGWAVSAGQRFRLRTETAVRISIATLLPPESEHLAADLAAVLRPTAGATSIERTGGTRLRKGGAVEQGSRASR